MFLSKATYNLAIQAINLKLSGIWLSGLEQWMKTSLRLCGSLWWYHAVLTDWWLF